MPYPAELDSCLVLASDRANARGLLYPQNGSFVCGCSVIRLLSGDGEGQQDVARHAAPLAVAGVDEKHAI